MSLVPRLRSGLRWLPACFVLVFGYIYALGFISIYSQEHVYVLASRWMYENIPARSVISGVHWDDSLPLSLPGLSSSRFRTGQELPLYEADSRQKIEQVAARLAASDYLVFPTQRLQGSLLRVPLEFPLTAGFFRMLFSNGLGYELVKTFKLRPRFWFLEFNDDLADESLSVYDHSKVSIFRNVSRLSAQEIAARIYRPSLTAASPGLREIMLMDRD